ncbi:hypothetical protein DSM106972_072830 [Dulcicalothrix desertica PCC 7102]|uniref:Uncharacterized protein n=1 Tax=Dulcicalothrix desertica PCC 7102 TaxID=232991 RepID=A0A3S1C632_9CYAN|nr:hypothetical protein [Dulcicalothrix desertica]RUT00874.1 hypothetical protein DSM106972_072830 [Dulcicalothrix desertica PCC 7102]TWH42289.1 hypothetical protein CAL7102_05928 [Dulcicalothrix desertica PCC 7102]
MNNQPYVPPPEVRERLSANLKKTEEEMKEMGKSLDKLLAHLDAQIASQPKRTKQTLPQN